VVRAGIEPPTHGFSVRQPIAEIEGKTQIIPAMGAFAGAVGSRIEQHTQLPRTRTECDVRKSGIAQQQPAGLGVSSAELNLVIDSWPLLPESIKAGILAMVRIVVKSNS
jgi:hypothetical protein